MFQKGIFTKPWYTPDRQYKRSYCVVAHLGPFKAANLIPDQHTVLMAFVYTWSDTLCNETALLASDWLNSLSFIETISKKWSGEGEYSGSEIRRVLTGYSGLPQTFHNATADSNMGFGVFTQLHSSHIWRHVHRFVTEGLEGYAASIFRAVEK